MSYALKSKGGPAYLQIDQWLRNQIYTGRLQPGAMMPTELEVSSQFSVTHMTVRKAYKRLEDDRLVRRKRGSGTFVQDRSVWRNHTTSTRIGLITWDKGIQPQSYQATVMEGLVSNCSQSALTPIRLEIRDQPDELEQTIDREKLDGLIAFYPPTAAYEEMLLKTSIPKLVLEYERKHEGLDNVVIDCFPGVYQAMECLLELGHQRIDYVGALVLKQHGNSSRYISPQDSVYRLQAWRKALDDNGIERHKTAQHEIPYEIWAAEKLVKELLNKKEPPTALLTFDDHIARKLEAAVLNHGKRPGMDVSIVGFGAFPPPKGANLLPTVEVDWRGMASLAVQRMDERLKFKNMGGLTIPVKTKFIHGEKLHKPCK